MTYYNNYPYTMPDRLSQYPQYQQPQYQQQNNGILWVSGEIGAKSYLVAPGSTVLLMDSEAQKFYLKSTDMSGIPNLRTFEYKEVLLNAQKAPEINPESLNEQFVTREEYNEMRAQYGAIIKRLNEIAERGVEHGESFISSAKSEQHYGTVPELHEWNEGEKPKRRTKQTASVGTDYPTAT